MRACMQLQRLVHEICKICTDLFAVVAGQTLSSPILFRRFSQFTSQFVSPLCGTLYPQVHRRARPELFPTVHGGSPTKNLVALVWLFLSPPRLFSVLAFSSKHLVMCCACVKPWLDAGLPLPVCRRNCPLLSVALSALRVVLPGICVVLPSLCAPALLWSFPRRRASPSSHDTRRRFWQRGCETRCYLQCRHVALSGLGRCGFRAVSHPVPCRLFGCLPCAPCLSRSIRKWTHAPPCSSRQQHA